MMTWGMAERIGKVVRYRGGWRIRLPGNVDLYTHRGIVFEGERGARRILTAIRERLVRGELLANVIDDFRAPRRAHHTVERWAKRLLEDMERRVARIDRSPNYLAELQRWHEDHWRPIYGKTVFELDTSHVVALERALEDRGLHPNTVTKCLGGLHRVLTFAEENLPTKRGFRVPRFPRRSRELHHPTVPTIQLRDQVMAQIPEERRGIFLAMRLAIRPGEARAFDLSDYDFATHVLDVRWGMQGQTHLARRGPTKERTWRLVQADGELAAWLAQHVPKGRRLEGGPLFRHPEARRRKGSSDRWTMSSVEDEWGRACTAVGVNLRLYASTKHATLSHMVRHGATLYAAQHAAGHADPKSTQLYAKLEPITMAEVFGLPGAGPVRHRKRRR